MTSEFKRILIKNGFNPENADTCAGIFTRNSLEGVYSHGVNRFPRFVKNIGEGFIKPDAVPTIVHKTGSLEQWNGNLGPGPLNALFATNRVMKLAEENTIGLLALSHTNHWMRGGTYGWHAAGKGYIMICWTNTCPNMPAWGAKDPRVGNNPLVIAIPRENGSVVLDFAMSLYSYGKLETYISANKDLPYPGGFNKEGELTTKPSEILESWRILPAGYWKGSSLSLVLDILATVLTGGLSTHQIKSCSSETNISQVFIAIDIRKLHNFPAIGNAIDQIIIDLHRSVPVDKSIKVRYPGENVSSTREYNLKNGIPVLKDLWDKITRL